MARARATSPSRFNRDHYYDPNFTAEITAKMQVPKRIKIAGSMGDDDDEFMPQVPWQPEKIDMRVPDRILVAGQDKHIGTPAPPRELIMENTIMPPDPGMIRVNTPPRVLTLDNHYFPSAVDDYEKENGIENQDEVLTLGENNIHMYNNMNQSQSSFALDQSVNARDFAASWSNGPFLKTEEEMVHLRKQLVKMNRRVVNIERELVSRQQRDKIVFGVMTAYFFMKVLMWINKN